MGESHHVCVSGGKKCLFLENFGVLCFLETPVLRFALLSYYRRFICNVQTPLSLKNSHLVIIRIFFLVHQLR